MIMKKNLLLSLLILSCNLVQASAQKTQHAPMPENAPISKLYVGYKSWFQEVYSDRFVPFTRKVSKETTSANGTAATPASTWKNLRVHHPFTAAVALNRFWHTYRDFEYDGADWWTSNLAGIKFSHGWNDQGKRIFTTAFSVPTNPDTLKAPEKNFVEAFDNATAEAGNNNIKIMDAYTRCMRAKREINCTSEISDEVYRVTRKKYEKDSGRKFISNYGSDIDGELGGWR